MTPGLIFIVITASLVGLYCLIESRIEARRGRTAAQDRRIAQTIRKHPDLYG